MSTAEFTPAEEALACDCGHRVRDHDGWGCSTECGCTMVPSEVIDRKNPQTPTK